MQLRRLRKQDNIFIVFFTILAILLQANSKRDVGLSVVVGPFYQNMAMILEDKNIPYVVTDYSGFDWSDVSLVDSKVKWKNIVEVRPPMKEFNGAIVDYFILKNWESAVMIMPEHPRENQGKLKTVVCNVTDNQ